MKPPMLTEKELHKLTDHWQGSPTRIDELGIVDLKIKLLQTVAQAQRDADMEWFVEWLKEHGTLEQCDRDTQPYFEDYYWINKADWEALLAEVEGKK